MPFVNLETAPSDRLTPITDQVKTLVDRSQVCRGLIYLMAPLPGIGLAVGNQTEITAAAGAHSLALMIVDRQVFLPPTQNIYVMDKRGPRRIKLPAKVMSGEV